jgi:hypothetical protein
MIWRTNYRLALKLMQAHAKETRFPFFYVT